MHVPTRRMDCWTDDNRPRPWMHMDLYRLQKLDKNWHNPVLQCMAFANEEQLQALNGAMCDGCARRLS